MNIKNVLIEKFFRGITVLGVILGLVVGVAQPQSSVQAASSLTVTPITWDVVGLDSNDPVNSGPENFPVGVRVCNPAGSTTSVNAVQANFVWTSSNANIILRPGSLNPIVPSPAINLAPGQCTDFYFEISVDRDAAPYDQFRRYRIDVSGTDSGTSTAVTASSPTPRQIFVEHLVSQSRNAVTDVQLDGISIPAGGSMNLLIGNTYEIKLIGSTATNGYEQIESFINFPNTIFQILSVATTYTAKPTPVPDPILWANRLYADGCGWVNNPTLPSYNSCTGTGKFGGNITVTYQVKIISTTPSTQTLNTLIYDFSGSSFHYNADYGVGARIVNIIDPSSVTISKVFTPASTVPGGVSRLTFTLYNPNGGMLRGLNFTDTFPVTPGAMVVANPPDASTSGCGTPTFAPAAGAGSISFSNGTIAGNGYCTVSVNVTVPVEDTYDNTSGNLFIGSIDTGHSASASLLVSTDTTTPPACTPDLELAYWDFSSSLIPTWKSSRVSTATAGYNGNVTSTIPDTQNGQTGWSLTSIDGSWPESASPPSGYPFYGASPNFEFLVDSSRFLNVAMRFDFNLEGNWASSNNNHIYVWSNSDSGSFGATPVLDFTPASKSNWYPNNSALASSTGLNTTGFRVNEIGAKGTGTMPRVVLDNVSIRGCGIAAPPTITKSFTANPIAVNGISTLAFTLSNENNVPLTGVKFTDQLPAGVKVASPANASTSCGGTWTPAANDTLLTFGSPTGATIPARSGTTNGSCTVRVDVTATTAGPHNNISGNISSAESGTNTGPGGTASATLTAVLPPQIAKRFAPNPIVAGGTSTLTFTITNPNTDYALTGLAFTDTFPTSPGLMTVANPLTTTNTCGGSLLDNTGGTLAADDPGIQLTGGNISGGQSCSVSVNVTAPTNGPYSNTSGNVSAAVAGNGNTASDILNVVPTRPAISLLKQISTSPTGPWSSNLVVTVGTNIYYRFIVSNDGDVLLTAVNVFDPPTTPVACSWQNGDGTPLTAPFNFQLPRHRITSILPSVFPMFPHKLSLELTQTPPPPREPPPPVRTYQIRRQLHTPPLV